MNFKNRRMLNDTVRVDLATNAENKLTANENHLQNSDVKHVKNGKKNPFLITCILNRHYQLLLSCREYYCKFLSF